MREYNMQEIAQAIEVLNHTREAAIKNSQYGFKDDWVTFMTKMRTLTPQSSGARIQNYIFRVFGWTRIKSSENKGDVRNSLWQCFEVKVTVITSSNTCANIVQIRPWQEISGHHIFVIDATNNYQVTHFFLSRSEMQQEIEMCGTSAHGTKEANATNRNLEWAIRINWCNDEDKIFKRWIQRYKQDSTIGVNVAN